MLQSHEAPQPEASHRNLSLLLELGCLRVCPQPAFEQLVHQRLQPVRKTHRLNGDDDNDKVICTAFWLVMSQVQAGQVSSLQSSIETM